MKRLLLLAGVLAFMWWRHERMDAHDKANGFGAFADRSERDATR